MRFSFLPTSLSVALAATSLVVSGAGVVGCGSDQTQPSEDDVTSIKNSAIKDQKATGNCWLYASLAWVESLNLASGAANPLQLSPAYLNYWQWYDQLVLNELSQRPAETLSDGTAVAAGPVPTYGGTWGLAMDYIHRYGVMKLGSFASDDAEASIRARLALRKALAPGGELSSLQLRKDKSKVRAVLDSAFGLSPEVSRALTEAFGTNGDDTFAKSVQKPSYDANGIQILRSKDVPVSLVKYANGQVQSKVGTLAQAMGTGRSGLAVDFGMRTGEDAWSSVIVTSMYTANDLAALSKRLRRALNASAPMPMSFRVDKGAKDELSGAFKGPMTPKDATHPGIGGEHLVLLTDYEVTNVPGFGTLRAGQPATEAQMAAALDDTAIVSFFRVKNSWGEQAQANVGELGARGYYDLYTDYLFTKVIASGYELYGFVNVAVPPGF